MSQEKLYEEGFNHGYYLENNAPGIAQAFKAINSSDPYIQGVHFGIEEKEAEKNIEHGEQLDQDLKDLEDLRSSQKQEGELDL